MLKGILYRYSGSAKFGFALIFVILSFCLTYLVGIVLSITVFQWDIFHNPDMLKDLTNPESIKVLKFFQLISSIGLFVLPPFLFAYFVYPSIREFLRLRKIPSLSKLSVTILAGICFLPFSNLLAWINSFMTFPEFMSGIELWMQVKEKETAEITNAFLNVNDFSGLFYNIILIAVIPAIGEELLFRGVLQRIFTEWFKNAHWGIWISAILFSAIHLQFFGFLPRLFLGVFFGYILEATGSLWIPIIAHFINNLTGVLLSYFVAKNSLPQSSNDFGMTSETWIYGIIGGIIGGVLFWIIVRRKRNSVL